MSLSSGFTQSGSGIPASPADSGIPAPPPDSRDAASSPDSGSSSRPPDPGGSVSPPDREVPAPPSPLIGALLRVPFETVRDRMLSGLHERGFTDLVAAHLDVFQYPGPENQRPLQLAIQTRMSKQALNYLLGQLQQLGYLTREPDDYDQRSKRVRLTARGHAAIKAIREIVQEVENEWEQQLGARKFGELRKLLTQLYGIAATSPEGRDRAAHTA